MSGSDSNGCIYDGQVTVLESTTNVYGLQMSISGCYNPIKIFDGLATLLDTSSNADTLLFAAGEDVDVNNIADSIIGVMDRQ